MRLFRAAAVYFLQIFGTGFALAFIRIPFLVPRFGVRIAELMEMPVMLAVIAWASHRLARRHLEFGRGARLAAGVTAFCMLVGAELGVAWMLGASSPATYIASRDPVSGSVYLASLVFFAVAPALWRATPEAPTTRRETEFVSPEMIMLRQIRRALAAFPGAEIVYRSEWLGYLPFGLYHRVEVPRGKDISRDFPEGWTLAHLEKLESAGRLCRLSFRQDAEDADDIEIVFFASDNEQSGESHQEA